MVNRPSLPKLAALAITIASQFLPSDAAAQGRLSLAGRIGVAVPVGSLADFQKAGASFGGGVAFHVHPRFTMRTGVDLSFMEGKRLDSGTTAPGVNLFHYFLAAEWALANPRAPFSMAAGVGAGATKFDVEAFVIPQDRPGAGQSFVISEVYPTLHGRLQLGYAVTRRLDFVVSGRIYRVFVNEDDTRTLEQLSDEIEPLDAAWSVPIAVGVQIRM